MSQSSEECATAQGQACEETQKLQVVTASVDVEKPCSSPHLMASSPKGQTNEETQVSTDVKEPSSSSQLLMASNQEDPADETPSTSRGFQPPSASSSEYAAGLSNQVQGIPVIPPGHPNTMDLPVMTVDGKVDFLVNYMLYKYQMREMMSMDDIMRLVIREDVDHFHEILMRASDRIEMVFGLEVREVDPVKHYYALFIKLGLTYDGMRNNEYSFPKTGLLIVILGVVFMKGNRATEDEIWEVLNPMGIYAGMNHFIFGDPRELITDEFVREQYLAYQPIANSDPVEYEYVWGVRAKAETSKMRVLEFVAKIHGSHPTAFPSQYEEALIEEEERTLIMILQHAGPSSASGERSSDTSSNVPHI